MRMRNSATRKRDERCTLCGQFRATQQVVTWKSSKLQRNGLGAFVALAENSLLEAKTKLGRGGL
jgi:hypothetical protein